MTAIVRSASLHSDSIMAGVRERIPELLFKYFQFPNYWPHQTPPRKYEANDGVHHVNEVLDWMFEGGKLVVNWATDHGKSITTLYFFPILSLMANPDEAHIIAGANLNDAKRRLQMIQRTLETGEDMEGRKTTLLEDFPWIKKPVNAKQRGIAWSTTQLTVDGRSKNMPNPSIYAGAIGSADLRGRRGKLLLDDIEGQDIRHSALKRRQLYEWVKIEAVRCFESPNESKRPLIANAQTPMDPDSISLRLESENWKVTRLPCYTVPWEDVCKFPKDLDMRYKIPDSYFLWPAKRDKVLDYDPHFGHGMNIEQFALSYLCDPTQGNPSRLTLKEIQRLTGQGEFTEKDQWFTYISLDSASGSESGQADYAGVTASMIRWPKGEELPMVQVLYAIKNRQGLFEQVNQCADLAAELKCPVIVEANFGGSVYRNAFSHLRPEVKLIEVYTTRDKKLDEKMGLTVIRTLVHNGRLRVAQSQLDSDGIQAFMREIRDLGSDKYHDHLCCSLWFPVRYLYDQVRMMGYSLQPYKQTSFGSGAMQRSWGGAQSFRNWRR